MNVSEMSREQLEALVQQQAQAAKKNVVVKVSQKGCVQINGIRRFPITFYKNEWEQIFSMKDEIVQFIEDNDHLLAKKEAQNSWPIGCCATGPIHKAPSSF